METKEPESITVCSECERASCWHGEFMCEKSTGADIKQMSRTEWESRRLEHPDVWHRALYVHGEISEAEYRERVGLR